MWVCEVQIPREAHRIQEGANAPPPKRNHVGTIMCCTNFQYVFVLNVVVVIVYILKCCCNNTHSRNYFRHSWDKKNIA